MEESKRLARIVLTGFLGDVSEKVFSTLLDRGQLTLKEILEISELPAASVRDSLASLIRFHMVSFTLDKGQCIYIACLPEACRPLRHARYVAVARQLFGPEGQHIMTALLTNGVLMFDELLANVVQILGESGRDKAVRVFASMVGRRYVMRAIPPAEGETVPADKAGETDHLRFTLPSAVENLVTGSTVTPEDDIDAVSTSEPKAKRARMTSQAESLDLLSKDSDRSVLWMVNTDQLHVYMRNKAIVDHICMRIDSQAANVVKALLLQTESRETAAQRQSGQTQPVGRFKLLESLAASVGLSSREVDYYLDLLCSHSEGIVKKLDEQSGGRFVVDTGVAVDVLKAQLVESVVQESMGVQCSRIYRLVAAKKLLESKQISDMAMIPFKEAKETIYRLLVAGFLHLQEVPRTADHAPSRTFYLLSSQPATAQATVVTRLIKTLGNVLSLRQDRAARFASTMEQVEHALLSNGQTALETDLSTLVGLKDADRAAATKLQSMLKRLDIATDQLDRALMTLQDF